MILVYILYENNFINPLLQVESGSGGPKIIGSDRIRILIPEISSKFTVYTPALVCGSPMRLLCRPLQGWRDVPCALLPQHWLQDVQVSTVCLRSISRLIAGRFSISEIRVEIVMTRRNWINTESPENGCIYNLNHDQTILIDCQCLFFFYLVKKSSGVRKSFKYLVQAKVWILTLAPKSTIILNNFWKNTPILWHKIFMWSILLDIFDEFAYKMGGGIFFRTYDKITFFTLEFTWMRHNYS